MIIICSKCGKINEVKERRWRKPFLSITCRHCGQGTTIHVGATAPSADGTTYPVPLDRPPREKEKTAAPDRTAKESPSGIKVVKFLAVALVIVVLLTMGIVAGIFYVMKASDAYRTAESFILNSEEIRAAVGTPLRFGPLPAGSVRTRQGQGTADFRIHVKGPKGETDVRITLNNQGGRWKVLSAVFTDAGGTRKKIPGETIR